MSRRASPRLPRTISEKLQEEALADPRIGDAWGTKVHTWTVVAVTSSELRVRNLLGMSRTWDRSTIRMTLAPGETSVLVERGAP